MADKILVRRKVGLPPVEDKPQSMPKNAQKNYQPESWLGYSARNVAKIPTNLYETARSGLGAGNILQLLAQRLPAGEDMQESKQNLMNLMRIFTPTTGQARQEAEAVLPQYMTESRRGDAIPEFLTRELPLLAATGGLSGGLRGLGRAAGVSLGALGGSVAGGKLGGIAGKSLGDEELGEALGGLIGGAGGGAITRLGMNRPTKALPQKLNKKADVLREVAQDEQQSLRAVASDESTLLRKETDARADAMRSKSGETQEALVKNHNEKVAAIEKEGQARIKSLEDQHEIELGNIEKAKTERSQKINELEEGRAEPYAQAKKAGKGLKGPAAELSQELNEIADNIGGGVEEIDQGKITHMIKNVDKSVHAGEGAVSDLVDTKQNINGYIYNKNSSSVLKEKYKKIRNAISSFLYKVGEANPEFGQPFQKAENMHISLHELKKGNKEFLGKQKQLTNNINKKYARDMQAAKGKLTQELKEINKNAPQGEKATLGKSLKENYDNLKKDQKQRTAKLDSDIKNVQTNLNKQLSEIGSMTKIEKLFSPTMEFFGTEIGVNSAIYGLSQLTGIPYGKLSLARATLKGGLKAKQIAAREFKIIKQVYEKHPELLVEYGNDLVKFLKDDSPRNLHNLLAVGDKMNDYAQQEKPKKLGNKVLVRRKVS